MQDRLSWAQSACARVMRPLVRLALGMGLKHPHLEEMLREHMIGEIALAIEMGADAVDIGKTIHPHPS